MVFTKEQIDHVFEGKTDQWDAWLAVYKLLFPDWDRIDKINGYPECGDALGTYLFECFIGLDRVYHPDVLAGGLWMNSGWSTTKDMGAWQVLIDPARCKVTYKE